MANQIDIIIAIYNLKFPDDISKIISKYSVSILYCSNCSKILQSDNLKRKSTSWVKTSNKILCKSCYPSLGDLYHHRKLKINLVNLENI